MIKKYLFLTFYIFACMTMVPVQAMEDVPEAERLFKDKPQNINFIFGGHSGGSDSVSVGVKRGFYGGLEQGTANIVAALMVQTVTLGIHKGVEWLQQPSEEELKMLVLQMQIKNMLDNIEKNIEKKQRVIAAYGTTIATLGQNVDVAQRIYAGQVHKEQEQSPEDKYLEIYNALSDMTIESLKEQRIMTGGDASKLLNAFQAEE